MDHSQDQFHHLHYWWLKWDLCCWKIFSLSFSFFLLWYFAKFWLQKVIFPFFWTNPDIFSTFSCVLNFSELACDALCCKTTNLLSRSIDYSMVDSKNFLVFMKKLMTMSYNWEVLHQQQQQFFLCLYSTRLTWEVF